MPTGAQSHLTQKQWFKNKKNGHAHTHLTLETQAHKESCR